MTREIFYTFNAAAPPPDPTVNSTKYPAGGIAYPVGGGYFKSIAKEGNDFSAVTSKSFERAPEDYVHYYPLTADFNDYAGSNNLINSGCIVGENGCLIDAKNDYMKLTTPIDFPIISISFSYRFDGTGGTYNTFYNSNNINYHHLFTSPTGTIGIYANGFYYSKFTMSIGATYKIVFIINGTNEYLYIDNVLVYTWSLGWNNTYMPIQIIGNTSSIDQGLLGLIKDIKIYNRALSQEEINSL